MNIQPNQEVVLDLLAKNEENIGRLYKVYADLFSEYRELWSGLADEEKVHAARIRSLKSQVGKDHLSLKPNRFKSEAIRFFSSYIEQEIIAAGKGGFSLIKALSISMHIEDSLIERRYFEVFESDAVEMKNLLQELEAGTRQHAGKIRNALNQYRAKTGI